MGVSTWVDESWRYFDRPEVEAALEGDSRAAYLTVGAATANAVGDFPRQAVLAERGRSLTIEPGGVLWRAATGLLANALSIFEPSRSAALYDEHLAAIPEDQLEERGYILARSADPALMTLDLEEGARRLDEAVRVAGVADMDLGLPHLLLGRLDDVHRAIGLLEETGEAEWTVYRPALLAGLLAAVEGRVEFHAAEQLTAAAVERLPVHLVDRDVLNAFVVLAHHRGDHHRALLRAAVASTGNAFGRSPGCSPSTSTTAGRATAPGGGRGDSPQGGGPADLRGGDAARGAAWLGVG